MSDNGLSLSFGSAEDHGEDVSMDNDSVAAGEEDESDSDMSDSSSGDQSSDSQPLTSDEEPVAAAAEPSDGDDSSSMSEDPSESEPSSSSGDSVSDAEQSMGSSSSSSTSGSDDSASGSASEVYSSGTDSEDESYVPLGRRNPHRAAHDPAFAGAAAPDPAPAAPAGPADVAATAALEREHRLRAQRELERVCKESALAKLSEAQAHADAVTVQLREAEAEIARLKQEHQDTLDTAAGELPAAPRGSHRGNDMHKVLNKPAPYDGFNDTCHVVDWLVAMFHYLVTLGVPLAMYVTTASTYLRGEALRFWSNRSQTLSTAEASSWDKFKEALLERFDSENTAVSSRIKLDQLKQGDMSMAKFVQKFDLITSYIPDMSDADLIHRFLMAVRPECKPALQNNPGTGVRWTEYVKLRKYALNMFPFASIPNAGKSPKPSIRDRLTFPKDKLRVRFGDAADAVGTAQAFLRSKGGKLGTNGGVNKPTAGGGGGSGSGQGASGSGGTRAKVYTNANGKKASRNPEQVRAIFATQVCGYCYSNEHRAGDCTAAQPAKGFPQGA